MDYIQNKVEKQSIWDTQYNTNMADNPISYEPPNIKILLEKNFPAKINI